MHYKEVGLKDLPGILLQGGITTGIVMLLIGASSGMSWVLASQNVPQMVSEWLLGISENPIVLLLVINILLLLVGTFMDMTPAVLIFTPIFLPVMQKIGQIWGLSEAEVSIHFGIIIITNLCIGLCTPRWGLVSSSVQRGQDQYCEGDPEPDSLLPCHAWGASPHHLLADPLPAGARLVRAPK